MIMQLPLSNDHKRDKDTLVHRFLSSLEVIFSSFFFLIKKLSFIFFHTNNIKHELMFRFYGDLLLCFASTYTQDT